MLISQIAKQVVSENQAVMLRPRDHETGKPKEYDVKPLFVGNKHGWALLDATTAKALDLCYDALNEKNKAKWDTLPLGTVIDFAWKHVSF